MDLYEHINQIKDSAPEMVYFLYGNDFYLTEEAVGELSRQYQAVGAAAEVKRYYGGNGTDDSFVNSLSNLGMFSPRQIIVYKEITSLKPNHRKTLQAYLKKPDPNILLILTASGQSRSSLIGTLKKQAVQISVWTPPERSFPNLVLSHLGQKEIEIEPEALDLLLYATNDDLSHTFSELEKVLIYIGPRRSIRAGDIRAVVGGAKAYQMSDFIDAVLEHRLTESYAIARALIQSGTKAPYFVMSLFHLFQNIWAFPKVHAPQTARTPRDKRNQARFRKGYNNYKDADFAYIFHRLTDVDLKAKSVKLSTEELITPLIYEILHA